AEPDLVLDLGQPMQWPVARETRFGGRVQLEPGTVERVYANNVLEHAPDLPTLMGNVLALPKDGGEFDIEVPYAKALTSRPAPAPPGARPRPADAVARRARDAIRRPGAARARHGGAGVRQQRARARAGPADAHGQRARAAEGGRRVRHRGALREGAHRLAGPDPPAGDERELLALLHRMVLVPRVVRAPLRDRALAVAGHAAAALRPGLGRLHEGGPAQDGHHAARESEEH